MNTTKSIAVIAPNWLGDAVMSLPLVGMLGAADATVPSPRNRRVFFMIW